MKKCSWITSFPAQPGPVEIGEDQPNGNRNRLFIQSSLQKGSQPQSLCFGREGLKAGQGMGELHSEEKERLQVCPDWSSMGLWKLEAG